MVEAKKKSSELIVEIKSLDKWFGKLHVLKNINLSVEKGAKIVIFGPPGSGKSTLIRTINQLEVHQQGQVLFKGHEMHEGTKNLVQLQAKIGFLFQDFNLFPHLSILENCIIAPIWVQKRARKEANKIAMECLERVHLSDHAKKYPAQLTAGQQQCAAIARSLCTKPDLLLFDEPTATLDSKMSKQVLDVIIELAQGETTMICVTHEIGFAKQVADRVLFMAEGELLEENKQHEFATEQLTTHTTN